MKKTNPPKKGSNLILGIGLVLILIGLLGVFFLPPTIMTLLASRLSEVTGLPVNIRNLNISFSAPEFFIKDLKFLNPKGFPASELANIGEVKVQYVPPPLVLGRLDVKKVEVNFKELRLVRNEAGDINLPIQLPIQAVGDTIDEVVLNLGSMTYTDLSGKQPLQKTYELGLNKAIYRNVKGVAGIMEIISWEVQKRAGIEKGSKEKQNGTPAQPAVSVPEATPASATPAESSSSKTQS